MKMRKIAVVMLITGLLTAAAAAQTVNETALLDRIGVNEQVLEEINKLNLESMELAREASVEQKLLQARLEKLLLEPDPDMNQVEARLRESLEWKLKVEMQKIRRSAEIRQLLGEEQWMKLLQYRKEARNRTATRTGGLPAGNEPSENRESRSNRNEGSSGSGGNSGGSSSTGGSSSGGRR